MNGFLLMMDGRHSYRESPDTILLSAYIKKLYNSLHGLKHTEYYIFRLKQLYFFNYSVLHLTFFLFAHLFKPFRPTAFISWLLPLFSLPYFP